MALTTKLEEVQARMLNAEDELATLKVTSICLPFVTPLEDSYH
jgi:hypothetical protein